MSFKVSNRHLQNEIIATKIKYDNDNEIIKVKRLKYELSEGMLTEYEKI